MYTANVDIQHSQEIPIKLCKYQGNLHVRFTGLNLFHVNDWINTHLRILSHIPRFTTTMLLIIASYD